MRNLYQKWSREEMVSRIFVLCISLAYWINGVSSNLSGTGLLQAIGYCYSFKLANTTEINVQDSLYLQSSSYPSTQVPFDRNPGTTLCYIKIPVQAGTRLLYLVTKLQETAWCYHRWTGSTNSWRLCCDAFWLSCLASSLLTTHTILTVWLPTPFPSLAPRTSSLSRKFSTLPNNLRNAYPAHMTMSSQLLV